MDGRASIRWLWLAGARCRRGRASSVPTSSTSCGPTSGRAHTTGRLRIGVGHLKAAGKRNCASRDKVSEPASRRQEQAQRLNSNGPKPANSALVARLQEIPGTVGLDGGPGRTRTSNQTVMSGGIKVAAVDFPAHLAEVERVCSVSLRSFLVRNWCGNRKARDYCTADTAADNKFKSRSRNTRWL
jgi:hypothetical protein